MKIFILLLPLVFITEGTPLKPTAATISDDSEGFPWMKYAKGKSKATTPSPKQQKATQPQPGLLPPNPPLMLTNKQLEDYVAAITASLRPYVIPDPPANEPPAEPMAPSSSSIGDGYTPPPKKSWKGKVPKQIKPVDLPATTVNYWDAEKKMYPDSFYDDFFMDWLRKRQVEESSVPIPTTQMAGDTILETTTQQVQQPVVPPSPNFPYPTLPMSLNPYLVNPYLYPLAGMKLSKTMVQAQVNAALTALNITTTPKPIKIKLKIPIPAGSDMAQVVSAGISGFPSGTTYELSKK